MYVQGAPDVRGVKIGVLDAPDDKRSLLDANSVAMAVSGHLVFVRDDVLFRPACFEAVFIHSDEEIVDHLLRDFGIQRLDLAVDIFEHDSF